MEDFKFMVENKCFNPDDFINNCVNWIREWFYKNGPGCNAIVGISGGKDSTVVAALLARALGPERVYGISIPDEGQNSDEAMQICKHLGVNFRTISISEVNKLLTVSLRTGLGSYLSQNTVMNIPPRLRMTVLYAISQTINGRVAGTCNASELYVGYATRYGDLASDFEPIADLTCRQVVEVGKALHELPVEWVTKTPSDDLPFSETDDEKFKKWGFSYATLDRYLETGTSGDNNIDNAIEEKHQSQTFKLGLGEAFIYHGTIH